MQTCKYDKIEKIIHKQIDRLTDLRIRQNREFFNVSPEQALDILLDLAPAFDDAVIEKYEDGIAYQIYPKKELPIPQKPKIERRKHFAFSMIDLKIGDKVFFDPLNIEVRIAGENKIEYEGRLWSLSNFTATYLPDEKRNTSGAYQGPQYFSYNGKTLWDIRLERESDNCKEG